MPPEEQVAPGTAVAGRGARARELVGILKRRAWILAACVVLIPVSTYVAIGLESKQYRASVILQPEPLLPSSAIVSNAVPTGWFLAPNASFIALVAQTPSVRLAAARLVHRSPAALGQITATTNQKTGWATIAVTAPTKRAAMAATTAVATAVGMDLQARTRASAGILQGSVAQQIAGTHDRSTRRRLGAQLAALSRIRPDQQQTVQVIAPAVDATPVSNRPGLAAAVSLIFALLVGFRLVMLVERSDHRIHDPAEVESVAGVPLLAMLPRGHVASPEPFLWLRDTIAHICGQPARTTLAVASPRRGEGRTSVALGLAAAYAAYGRSVVLVDADLRSPTLAARTGVSPSPGLAEVLSGSALDESLQWWDGPSGGLAILPAGAIEPDSPDLLASHRMTSALRDLSDRFEVVVFDTPPLLAFSDALPIAQQVAGIVVVAQVDRTPVRALQRGVRLLKDAGATVLGPVVTQAPAEAPGQSEASSSPRKPRRPRLTLPVVGAGEPGARR